MDKDKPLFWTGSSRRDLKGLPDSVQKTVGFALWNAQTGGRHVNAKVLKGFGGSGVLEVIENCKGDTYRAVYTVRFEAAVYVLHVFQKKSKEGIKTPKKDIALIKARLKAAEKHYAEWRPKKEEERGTAGDPG